MKHSPEGWADIAREYEAIGEYYNAARAWLGAKGASVGHKRRDRYERSYERCVAQGDEDWADFVKGGPKE